MSASTETLVAWTAALLLVGGIIALLAGVAQLARSRRQAYFRFRRQAILSGWRNVMFGVLFLLAAGVVRLAGQRAVEVFVPPTPTATASPTASLTATATLTPTRTSPPSATPPPTTPPPPSDTPDPTVSPTPARPLALLTRPAGTLTVTPPAGAVIANLRVGRFNDCASQRGVADLFATPPKTLFALFDYDGWQAGVEWTSVWLRDGQPVFAETLLWDGSTGGCGFADYDGGGGPWAEGAYEVQIFIGETWLGSATFRVYDRTPTP